MCVGDNPIAQDFFSHLKSGDSNLKSSTFKNNLLQIIGDIYASRKTGVTSTLLC